MISLQHWHLMRVMPEKREFYHLSAKSGGLQGDPEEVSAEERYWAAGGSASLMSPPATAALC